MRMSLGILVTILGFGSACTPPSDKTHASAPSAMAPSSPPPSSNSADAAAAISSATADAAGAAETALVPLVADADVGPLIARLSENAGDFPSENYVSNETSLLDVAPVLRDPKLRGRAYVGVGPEQSYSYLAMLEPRVAYIVDIRRGNLLEHMFFRGCFEVGTTRAEFLSALLSRNPQQQQDGGAATTLTDPGFSQLERAFASPHDRGLRDAGVARTKAVLDRLGVVRVRGDDATIARIQAAFATHSLSIAYTMTRAPGEYPTLGQNLAAKDPSGEAASFLASEASYARVRKLVIENRVLPIMGDFGGTRALRAVGEDMRERGLLLGVFYASNVEQYLFDGRKHGAFITSVTSMPRDEESRFVRVWFDPSGATASTTQPPKLHRTTQLTMPINPFLERAAKKPFRSYKEVVTDSPK